MANGVAATKLMLPATSASPSANDQEGIKTAIGLAMADATDALGAGLADLDVGGLTAANRARGGATIAKIVEMQLAALGDMPDFGAIALAEGRRTLIARHGAALRQQLGTDAGIDYTFGVLLAHVLAVASKVAAVERVLRAN
jgi:hypothetical protein